MAQIIDLNSRRQLSASKAYSPVSGEPYFHVGNVVLREMAMEEKEELVEKFNLHSNCDIRDEILLEYLDGELDQLTSSRVSRHIPDCPLCAERLEEFKVLSAKAQELSESKPLDRDIKSRLMKRLKSELGLQSEMFNQEAS